MEIEETNLQSAYNTADDNGKQMLRALFPDVIFLNNGNKQKLPITERIKTFNDACYELGGKHPYVQDYLNIDNGKVSISPDILTYLKLRIICAALNEGWEPKFTEDEYRYYPWFYLYTQQELDDMDDEEKQEQHMVDTGNYETEYCGFGAANSDDVLSYTDANFCSRLCLKNSELATYCGKQFIKLWADFNLKKKTK